MSKMHLIGNAHLDPVWQWRFTEGLALVKSTFKAALDRMDEFPDYVFTSACAGYYHWIYETEPEMFERIREKVREGRWCIAGGMWVQPDCNIPCGESFARHFLYSQRFFTEAFGFAPVTGYNVDSFGHNGMMPQLLIKAGLANYVYQRPEAGAEKPDMTKSPLHIWEGPEGSRVLCWHIPQFYCGDVDPARRALFDTREYPSMFFYGVGNHGGGPTVRMLEMLEEARKEEPGKYFYGGCDAYFKEVRETVPEDSLDVVRGDLQHHASGCYSANARIKALNRRAEESLIRAEALDVLAQGLTGGKSREEAIRAAWKRVMFNQFHDILAGCSIRPAYEDAYDGMRGAALTGTEVAAAAAERITWRIRTTDPLKRGDSVMRSRLWAKQGEGAPVVVFNPHSFPVKTTVSFGTAAVKAVLDSEDKAVLMQHVRAPYTDGSHKEMTLFEAELPAFGYRTYYLHQDETDLVPAAVENPFATGEDFIENDKIRLTFDTTLGGVKSFVRKNTSEELAAGVMGRGILIDDSEADTWGHMVFTFTKEADAFRLESMRVTEVGPLRAAMRVTSVCGNSRMTQDFILTRGSERVDVKVRLFFAEQYRMLKLSFPMKRELDRVVYSMPFGMIEKPMNGEEEPSQKWVDLCDASGRGLALLNNGKYSFSVKESELRMVAARGCAYLDHYGQPVRDEDMSIQDQGEQEFTYALMPHDESRLGVIREAQVLNMPCELYQETHHDGELEPDYSGIRVSAENVIVRALKPAEDGNGWILRAFEAEGRTAHAVIELPFLGVSAEADFAPSEIKTFRLFPAGGFEEVLLTEYPIG